MTNFSEELTKNDPEFAKFFDQFAFEEVANQNELDSKSRFMAILATLMGCQGMEEYKVILPIALDNDVTPVEAKEILYQATAYLGIGRTYPFLTITNEIMEARGIKLPLEPQGTTTPETRREAGTEAQVHIFGEGMKDFWKANHINQWLAANCFGDYYTRKGLDLRQREMITFCYIAAQGGCKPQLAAHTTANMMLGNDEEFLMQVVSHMVPYIGYPRSLNAISCIKEAAEKISQKEEK